MWETKGGLSGGCGTGTRSHSGHSGSRGFSGSSGGVAAFTVNDTYMDGGEDGVFVGVCSSVCVHIEQNRQEVARELTESSLVLITLLYTQTNTQSWTSER